MSEKKEKSLTYPSPYFDPDAFVMALYKHILKRAPAAEEVESHASALRLGISKPADLIGVFTESEEFAGLRSNETFARLENTIMNANFKNEQLYNLQLQNLYDSRRSQHANPLVKYGSKAFSQSDEDGITFEICRRLGLEKGAFLEFGVGDGTENNTLALLSQGWRGEWFGGQDLAFDCRKSDRLNFSKTWVTRENIIQLIDTALSHLSIKNPNLISIDLDGNDYFLIETILKAGIKPDVFVAEYNAKFIPPIRFTIDYNASHTWQNDDYYGASLSLLDEIFSANGYRLICCNAATGANAFFVKEEKSSLFPEVPHDIRDIFVPLNFNLYNYFGHKTSMETILRCIS